MLRNGNSSFEYQEISKSAFEPFFNRSNLYLEDPAIWPAVVELIKAGQYQEAAELLDKVQLIGQLLGREADNSFLVIARQICRACSQYQAEIAWHRQSMT
jgi:hypothetical protein